MKKISAAASAMLMTWRQRQHDRRAAHAARQLEEGDHRAGEGDGADGDADRHLDQALGVDVAVGADAERGRRIERARRHQHRRHADQRVERRDQLRHRGHRHAARDHRADAAAEPEARDHQDPGAGAGRRMRGERGADRDHHAGDAEHVAAAARFRARQPAQRQDEQDAGDEIEQGCDIGVHGARASLLFLLVHRQHALGDQEAAEDVDRGEHQRDEAERARPDAALVVGRRARRRPRAARRPRSPRRSRWSPTSAACAAPASPTRPRSSRRTPPARRSTAGTRTDRRRRARFRSWHSWHTPSCALRPA